MLLPRRGRCRTSVARVATVDWMEPGDHDRRKAAIGHAYLEHLSDHDVALLLDVSPDSGVRRGGTRVLRSSPELIERLLQAPAAFDAVFGRPGRPAPFLHTSPFLVFALAVHRAARELEGRTFVEEWMGPRRRVPVLGTAELRAFLADPLRRFFLTELLASYTHVASGSVWVRTGRGWRRRRFSELDPLRLASLLEVVPEADRAGVYRRLGDLALFLTGVFPDHTATHGIQPLDVERLVRVTGVSMPEGSSPAALPGSLEDLGPVDLLEKLGERWYRLACAVAPPPLVGSMQVVSEVADRFAPARRTVNFVTDRFLFPFRAQWFGPAGA
jgi:hypothetical protein